MNIPFKTGIPENFFWFNKPDFSADSGNLIINSLPNTDFWQRTHYGFSRDNGHALLTSVSHDFAMTVRTRFSYLNQFDQCGLYVRIDPLNWIKVSVEQENGRFNRIGSVVTNLGYSDWASSDIDKAVEDVWYRIRSKENDFHIDSSLDGLEWTQMRIAHLHNRQRPLNIGLYACSPGEGGYQSTFSDFYVEEN